MEPLTVVQREDPAQLSAGEGGRNLDVIFCFQCFHMKNVSPLLLVTSFYTNSQALCLQSAPQVPAA